MQTIEKRGEPVRIKLTKNEATRLLDAAYITGAIERHTQDPDLAALELQLRLIVAAYAPQWLEDDDGTPAKAKGTGETRANTDDLLDEPAEAIKYQNDEPLPPAKMTKKQTAKQDAANS